jgi:hypothetical protein
MAIWRLLGRLPQGKTREEIQSQSIDGWNPWRFDWSPTDEHAIVVPDPRNSSRFCHVKVAESGLAGSAVKFAALLLDDVWWFYVPATLGEQGAFEASEPRYEGFWRTRIDEESELPWPAKVEHWPARAAFLASLSSIEAVAERIAYRGYSKCRVCGCQNGFESLLLGQWEWPAGFRHYVEEHQVRPSGEFVTLIMGRKD